MFQELGPAWPPAVPDLTNYKATIWQIQIDQNN